MVAFNTSSVVWVIPAYNPDAKLVSLVASIREKDTDIPLLVVDDGSGFETQEIFDVLESKYHCIVVHHAVNMGKGRALKTALNEVLLRFPHVLGVVTLDADGQHLPEYIEGVRVLKGIELNILDSTGKVDMSERILKNLDIAIASLHLPCIDPNTFDPADFADNLHQQTLASFDLFD